jgi:MFS family permease
MHAEHSGRVRAPFVAVAYALVVMLAGSNLPTPLYPTYQRVFALSPLLVTLVYATYAFTVMPCLLVFGPLSDAVGRRPTLLAALAALPVVGVGALAQTAGLLEAVRLFAYVVAGACLAALGLLGVTSRRPARRRR